MRRGQAGILLIMLASILLLSLIVLFTTSDSGSSPFVGFLPRELLVQNDVGIVGGSSEGAGLRHIYLGRFLLSASATERVIISEQGGFQIARGMITGQEHEVFFERPEAGDVRMSFRVDGTNSLGSLLVRLNGKIVYAGKPQQGETIVVGSDETEGALASGSNRMTFATTSSGWRIWSPATYSLSSVVISDEEEGASPGKSFNFSLSNDELSSFLMGRVVFTVAGAAPLQTPLSIMINNATVWKAPASESTLPVAADFSSTGTGLSRANTAEFSVGAGGSVEIVGAEVIVFTTTAGRGTPTATFSMSRSDFEALRAGKMQGIIEATVSDISTDGTLQVSIIGDRESVVSDSLAAPGKLRATFGNGQAVFGKNAIVFQSPDAGVFRVSDLSVRLERI